MDAVVGPVPHIVVVIVAQPRPLEEHLDKHVPVHGKYNEPQRPHLPAVRHAQQGDGKGRLGQRLADERATRGDVDENVHAVVPFARVDKASREFYADDDVV